jgi:hypothetical protein
LAARFALDFSSPLHGHKTFPHWTLPDCDRQAVQASARPGNAEARSFNLIL